MGRIVGYARVSGGGWDTNPIVNDLLSSGVEPGSLFVDRSRIGVRYPREELRHALATLEIGDVLIVSAVSDLGKSQNDIDEVLTELRSRGAGIRMLKVNKDSEFERLSLRTMASTVVETRADV